MTHLDYTAMHDRAGGRWELANDRVTIGRDGPTATHFQLAEHFCSRVQLIFTRDSDGGYWLEEAPDIVNRTFLNGERLMPGDRRRLRDGDVIGVGVSELVYHE